MNISGPADTCRDDFLFFLVNIRLRVYFVPLLRHFRLRPGQEIGLASNQIRQQINRFIARLNLIEINRLS